MAEEKEEQEAQEELKYCHNCKTIIPEPFVDFVPQKYANLFCCMACLDVYEERNN